MFPNIERSLKNKQVLANKEEIIKHLSYLLQQAVKTPQSHLLGLSGGVDSALLAKLSPSATLVSVGVEHAPDLYEAYQLAKRMNWQVTSKEITSEQAEELIKKVINLLAKNKAIIDPINIGVGVVDYLLCEAAKEKGIKVLMSGLGAEEIFGGYQTHVECYKKYHHDPPQFMKEFQTLCFQRLQNIEQRDLARDQSIANQFGITLKAPFLDEELVTYAMQISPLLKVNTHERKLILREVAEHLGVPKEWAWRKKVAAQYGSKIDMVLKKLAKKEKKTVRQYLDAVK
jgi:asparagine synthase (glutamine-hydrolysing)